MNSGFIELSTVLKNAAFVPAAPPAAAAAAAAPPSIFIP